MADRVVSVLLAAVLVTAGSSAPFAHVHPHGKGHGAEQPGHAQGHARSTHDHGQRSHWHPVESQTADRPPTVSREHHHHTSIPLVTLAIERPGIRVGVTPALAEIWEARVVHDLRGRSVPVASNARPNPPPLTHLAARAPPL